MSLLDIWTLSRHAADAAMTHLDDFPPVLGASGDEIGYTTKLKVYPNGSTAATSCDKPIFRPAGWESRPRPKSVREPILLGDGPEIGPTREIYEREVSKARESRARSKRRALTKLRDYALSNNFQYFVTLTLDKTRIDRYDYAAIVRAMRVWCDNQVRRKGLYYVLVPELHKDGALHFHGFFPGGVSVEDSGTIIPPGGGKPRKPRSKRQRAEWLEGGGHLVYNLPDWSYGYSTAIELYGTYSAAVAYVCKYIHKAEDKVGGRWYFHGGPLREPEVEYTTQTIEEAIASATDPETGETTARVYEVPSAGFTVAYTFTEIGGGQAGVVRQSGERGEGQGAPGGGTELEGSGSAEPDAAGTAESDSGVCCWKQTEIEWR